MGEDAVNEVPTVYLEHDEIVMRFYLHIKSFVDMDQAWSESELKADRISAIKGLGDGTLGKLPDLLIEFKLDQSLLRCALEIERTRKPVSRYKSMWRSYLRATNVDLIIFGVANKKIEEAIRSEMFESGLEGFGKEVGFFELADFKANEFDGIIKMSGKEISLKNFFIHLTESVPESADLVRHEVRGKIGNDRNAA